MHHISKIHIKNFKSIEDGVFNLSGYTPLVGCNNAGKTNILKALEWVVKPSVLDVSTFNKTDNHVSISVTISGVSDNVLSALDDQHRARIAEFITNEEIQFRREQSEPGSGNKPTLQVLKNDGNWASNPTGIANAISALFPEAIFIEAMDDSGSDLSKNTTSSSVGKLIKEITDDIFEAHAEPVKEALTEVREKLQAGNPNRDEQLKQLDETIQAQVDKFFQGNTAQIEIPVPEFSTFLKSGTIKLIDNMWPGSESQDVKSLGHGTQRTVQIALIKCLADLKRSSGQRSSARTTMLLIDEPELYLHPQAIALVRRSLSSLADEGFQVVLTTHSPFMISRDDAKNTLIVRRKNGQTFALKTSKEAVVDEIESSDHQSEILFEIGNASEIFFSESVILIEGKTEKFVLPDLFARLNGFSLTSAKIGMVPLNGVENIPKTMKVLSAMNIPVKSVVDLDFAFRGAVQNKIIEEEHPDLIKCKEILRRLQTEGTLVLDDAGLPKKGNDRSASDGFQMLSEQSDAKPHIENIHNLLKDENIWLWQKGAIERHLELASKRSRDHLRFINDLETDGFVEELTDYENLKAMCEWLAKDISDNPPNLTEN